MLDMITPPCSEHTYIPNSRLRALMQAYESLPDTDESALRIEYNLRISWELQQSWQYPSGGSETYVNKSLLSRFFEQITSLLMDIELVVMDSNRPAVKKLMLTSQHSNPERVLTYRGNVLIGSDAKGGDAAEFCSLIQCLQICADAALSLYQQGMSTEDCVVPGVIACGEMLRIVAVYFLPPSYPVIVYLSGPLHVGTDIDRMKLARWGVVLASFARNTISLLQSSRRREEDMAYRLNTNLFLKPVRNIEKVNGNEVGAPRNGLDLSFARINLDSMMRVYSLVHSVPEAAHVVAFPLGVLTCPLATFSTDVGRRASQAPLLRMKIVASALTYFGLDARDLDHVPFIVYPLLAPKDGWKNTKPEPRFVESYLSQLACVVRVLNEARVAHMDLRYVFLFHAFCLYTHFVNCCFYLASIYSPINLLMHSRLVLFYYVLLCFVMF